MVSQFIYWGCFKNFNGLFNIGRIARLAFLGGASPVMHGLGPIFLVAIGLGVGCIWELGGCLEFHILHLYVWHGFAGCDYSGFFFFPILWVCFYTLQVSPILHVQRISFFFI